MHVAVIQHCRQSTARLDEALAAVGAEVDRLDLEWGDAVPLSATYDKVVVLGGAMGVYDHPRFPWLEDEKKWLRDLVDRHVPVLGICLGSQLLADALGGRAHLAEEPEAGVFPLQLTEAGRTHPVVSAAGQVVFSLHRDTFTLPPAATLLAHTDLAHQAFQLGSATAIQFHPDADLDLAIRWGEQEASILAAAGVAFDDYVRALHEADPELDAGSRRLFKTWLALD
ncbi:MAG: type 1 glutamine amidotransferase [Actinomycetota bacterium]